MRSFRNRLSNLIASRLPTFKPTCSTLSIRRTNKNSKKVLTSKPGWNLLKKWIPSWTSGSLRGVSSDYQLAAPKTMAGDTKTLSPPNCIKSSSTTNCQAWIYPLARNLSTKSIYTSYSKARERLRSQTETSLSKYLATVKGFRSISMIWCIWMGRWVLSLKKVITLEPTINWWMFGGVNGLISSGWKNFDVFIIAIRSQASVSTIRDVFSKR